MRLKDILGPLHPAPVLGRAMQVVMHVVPVAAVAAFLLPGGLLLFPCGMTLQRVGGRRAGRLRSALRELIAWSPALVFTFAMSPYVTFIVVNDAGFLALSGFTVLAALASGIYTAVRPERGLPDWLAGTVVVPR